MSGGKLQSQDHVVGVQRIIVCLLQHIPGNEWPPLPTRPTTGSSGAGTTAWTWPSARWTRGILQISEPKNISESCYSQNYQRISPTQNNHKILLGLVEKLCWVVGFEINRVTNPSQYLTSSMLLRNTTLRCWNSKPERAQFLTNHGYSVNVSSFMLWVVSVSFLLA